MKTVSALVRIFLISLITFSCSTPREEYIPIIAISLNQSEAELNEGSSLQLQVQIVPSNASDKTTMWGSSKPDVAKVSESGLVTALSAGKSTITATAGDKNATCTVTVIKPTIEVQSVTLDKDDITIVKGQTAVLKATINPADATQATVTWTTSDEVVAKVDQNGRVSAMGGGSAVITAAAGNKSADCSVTVTVLVESISLDRNEVTLVEDESVSLTATVLPDDATDKSVEWMSSNSGIATIDSEGNITAVKEGSATITAKSGDKTASCTVTVSKKIIHVESISIDRPLLNIAVGATETLTATVLPNDATDKSFTWASTNTTISEVDQTGRVTAKAAGTVTITATTVDGGLIAACEVTVYVPYVPVDNITLSNTTLNLNKGQTATLTAIISPTNATVQAVSWSSNNMDVAQIDRYGKVTAVGGGQATILAEAGNISAECVVMVSVPVESIELDHSQMTIVEGETATLQALVLPDDATDKTIAWTSSNTGVAIVDAEGNVTGQSEGSATITAKSGAANAVCTVIVSKKIIPVSSIEISKETLSLLVGETAHITATVYPENATDKSFIWTSSNTAIADVDQSGKVTAKAAGMVTITATTTDGGKIAACEVTVSVPYIEVTSITLDIDEVALEKGQTVTLIATVKPDNASVKTVTWSSSDTGIATVDKDGKMIAVVGGTAIITAKAGNCTATCTVIVTVPVTEVTLNKTELALMEGASETLYATITPADATYTGITWTSSDPNVATVDGDGKVTAHTEGSTIITAKAGDKSATCDVSVAFGAANYLTLSSAGQSSISLTIHGSCSPVLYYSTDATNWSRWDYSPLSFSSSSDLYLCGYNPDGLSNSASNYCTFESIGDLFVVEGNIMSLIDKNKSVAVIPCDYCFSRLFHNNTKLQSSPDLPAKKLKSNCYSDMFSGCTSLITAPSLPALELANNCYYGMFWNCTSIEETPDLPATQLAVYCYAHMFQKCTNLRSIHSLPASLLADYCYHEMFRECTSLILPPSLPATTLSRYCYWDMFRDCSSLTVAPALPATTLADYCYFGMFSGCDNLSSVSELPATTLKEGCYSWMYSKTAISSAPILKATNLTKNCYDAMFNCCSNLSFVQCLAQDISADGCISVWLDGVAASGVFYRSPSMASWEIGPSGIPSGWTIKRYGIDSDIIPVDAITLDKTSLELTVGQSVSLNATVSPANATDKTISWSSTNQSVATVSNGIVEAKSKGTTIITAMAGDKTATCSVAVSSNVINVSSITLNKASLTLTVGDSDVLIATIKPDDATDKSIIWASTNSAIASVDQTGKITAKSSGTVTISATTNDGGKVAVCEVSVVNQTIPVTKITLNKTSLSLSVGDSETLVATVHPENATNKSIIWDSTNSLIASVDANGKVSAIGVGTVTINATTKDGNYTDACEVTVIEIPHITASNYLTFESQTATTTISLENNGGNAPVLYYSTNAIDWLLWDYSPITFSKEQPLFICGENHNGFSSSQSIFSRFRIHSGMYSVSGNIMSLVNLGEEEQYDIPNEYCFFKLFADNKMLCGAPELPATTLTKGCYSRMFSGCIKLNKAPDLPANVLADNCYSYMFSNCTLLSDAPELPATSLAESCYRGMFYGCTSLKVAPILPATILANHCYDSMFQSCTGLTSTPELPANSLVEYCYFWMFRDCSNLSRVLCYAQECVSSSSTSRWLEGVAQEGTFIRSELAYWWPNGQDGIPSHWTLYNNKGDLQIRPTDIIIKGISGGGTIIKGQSIQLTVELEPVGATVNTIQWETSDPTVCVINSDGVLTGLSVGQATISVTAENITRKKNIKVEEPFATKFLKIEAEDEAWTYQIVLNKSGDVKLDDINIYYSFNTFNWFKWEGQWLSFSKDKPIYLCGDNPEGLSSLSGYFYFEIRSFIREVINGTQELITPDSPRPFSIYGDIMSLINKNNDVLSIPCSGCFRYLFKQCGGLRRPPQLTATSLTSFCYSYLFYECDKLNEAPVLSATILAPSCYKGMFEGCARLTMSPELPAVKLFPDCYYRMFAGCTRIESAPNLDAPTLTERCYYQMFDGCSKLNTISCMATDISAIDCTTGWVSNVAELGVLYKSATNSRWTNSENGIPIGWDIVLEGTPDYYLTITSVGESYLSLNVRSMGTSAPLIMFSYDKTHWDNWDYSDLSISMARPVYICGENKTGFSRGDTDNYCTFVIKGDPLDIAGTIGALIDCNEYLYTIPNAYCFWHLFDGCDKLKSVDRAFLSALNLKPLCYESMFKDCTMLTMPPSLPATTLAHWCYSSMFKGCTSIIEAPILPARTLVAHCYEEMFDGCLNLSFVKCLASSGILNTNNEVLATNNWLRNVSANGTFIKSSKNNFIFYYLWPEGQSGIPDGWEIRNEND